MDNIKRKQLIWYGHVQRMEENRLPKQIMIPVGKRRRGRPKIIWEMGIRRVISEKNLAEEQWNNRREWQLGIAQRRKIF